MLDPQEGTCDERQYGAVSYLCRRPAPSTIDSPGGAAVGRHSDADRQHGGVLQRPDCGLLAMVPGGNWFDRHPCSPCGPAVYWGVGNSAVIITGDIPGGVSPSALSRWERAGTGKR